MCISGVAAAVVYCYLHTSILGETLRLHRIGPIQTSRDLSLPQPRLSGPDPIINPTFAIVKLGYFYAPGRELCRKGQTACTMCCHARLERPQLWLDRTFHMVDTLNKPHSYRFPLLDLSWIQEKRGSGRWIAVKLEPANPSIWL